MFKKLCLENLTETVADYEKMDLIFDVDGVQIVAKGITDFDPQDADFFETEENLQRALKSARGFDIDVETLKEIISEKIYGNLFWQDMEFYVYKNGKEVQYGPRPAGIFGPPEFEENIVCTIPLDRAYWREKFAAWNVNVDDQEVKSMTDFTQIFEYDEFVTSFTEVEILPLLQDV